MEESVGNVDVTVVPEYTTEDTTAVPEYTTEDTTVVRSQYRTGVVKTVGQMPGLETNRPKNHHCP